MFVGAAQRIILSLRIENSVLVNQAFDLKGIFTEELKRKLFSGTVFTSDAQFLVFTTPFLEIQSTVFFLLVIQGAWRGDNATLIELRILKDNITRKFSRVIINFIHKFKK